jgi:hypothetical protein
LASVAPPRACAEESHVQLQPIIPARPDGVAARNRASGATIRPPPGSRLGPVLPDRRPLPSAARSAARAQSAAHAPRARRERPRRRCTSDKRDELAPSHSITSSAMASSVGGTSRPSALAVLRLITSSYLVGCRNGKSAGLSPLRIRPT